MWHFNDVLWSKFAKKNCARPLKKNWLLNCAAKVGFYRDSQNFMATAPSIQGVYYFSTLDLKTGTF